MIGSKPTSIKYCKTAERTAYAELCMVSKLWNAKVSLRRVLTFLQLN